MAFGWSELAYLGGGGAIVKVLDLLRVRTHYDARNVENMWKEIGLLHGEINALRDEVSRIREEKHSIAQDAQALRLKVTVLRSEVNDRLDDAGKAPKYDLLADPLSDGLLSPPHSKPDEQ